MKTFRFLSVLLLLCSLPLCAFAMDEGYLRGSEKWNVNNKAVFVPMEPEHLGGDLEGGYYQYYTDLSDNCFYLHISYSESSLKDNGGNSIHLDFTIKNSSNEYQFSVDNETGVEALNAFDVRAKFDDIWISGQEIYVGIEFLNKEDKKLNNYLSFSLTVNKTLYEICDEDIKLAYGDYAESLNPTKLTTPDTTTAPPSTTKKDNTGETTTKTESTTKFKYTYTTTTHTAEKEADITSKKTTKPKTETTTKFKYEGTAGSSSAGEYSQEAAENSDSIEENTTTPIVQAEAVDAENSIIIPDTAGTAGKPPQASLMTALAVICIVAGSAFIARNISLKKKNSIESNEEE